MRDSELRQSIDEFDHPAGLVEEDELKQMAGAGDVDPQTTPSSVACGIAVSALFCPTTKCTSQC
ncbi:class II lanthipeptide, LchA2/BrtA2 family [Lentibacillus amyloliquefaciens]|uniref:class II lanthipeptide, LchA2/BrtA2 family n=1 Tax=Lentibacillus amyloliquefaciens TaxID=1472767 RepID=UPI001F231BBB|nr:class II lanthipeptide, LchA2/BrtA2 family [Lentibacillus amyloliquefaciens]